MSQPEDADTPPAVALQTLDAVLREIAVALAEARVALDAHAAQPDDLEALAQARVQLALVRGVLRMLEIHAGALLAEESCEVIDHLQAAGSQARNRGESLDALLRAIAQLPGYLERVVGGGRDMALVLLPLLNDLRAVRGHALLSEGTLLLLNLKSDRQAVATALGGITEDKAVAHWARRLRARFQMGLVGWIRGDQVQQNLETLSSVARQLEEVATEQSVFQLWWVTGAVIEALSEQGLDAGVSIKRLMGMADRELRRLYEEGEARYAQGPPVELLNNLLYYVARASSQGPRVTAVRASFRLGEVLSADEAVEQERENLSAPSVKMMQTVAAAIREDLGRIKIALEDFMLRGSVQPGQLQPQVQLLTKMADTLGVLGLGEHRASVQIAMARLQTLEQSGDSIDTNVLVDVAATLIRVEDHLDADMVGVIRPRTIDTTQQPLDPDFQQVQAAVLRECLVNLVRIKDAVAQYVAGTLDAAGFDGWPELLRGIDAALHMLEKPRAAQVLQRIKGHVRNLLQGSATLTEAHLERLADAIVSLEYYLETLQAGRGDAWYMLDNADVALSAVEATVATRRRAAERADPHEPTQIVPPRTLAEALADPQATVVQLVPIRPPTPLPVMPPAVPALLSADADLQALYLEEAREELARIEHLFPVWDRDAADREALAGLRRAFHTLKGSGRMVGATAVADFCWSIESLFNKLTEGTLLRSPALMKVLRDAVRVLPQFIEQLAGGVAPQADIAAIVAAAQDCIAGRTALVAPVTPTLAVTEVDFDPDVMFERTQPLSAPVAPVLDESVSTQELPVVVDGLPDQSDGVDLLLFVDEDPLFEADATLRDIYARETDSHVSVVREFLRRALEQAAPQVLPEAVYRACHTLLGSSRMAQARHGIRLAQSLDTWLRKAFESGWPLNQHDVVLLGECMHEMERISRHLDESTEFFANHDHLRSRIQTALQAMETRAQPVMAAPSYDPEIAAIFSDEASELLEAAESALAQVPLTLASGAAPDLTGLKRPLHTLKGGARMAGVFPMGDLAHDMETLITRVDLQLAPWDANTQAVVQTALDELARMRDLLSAGRPVTAPAMPVMPLIPLPPPVIVQPVATPPAPVADLHTPPVHTPQPMPLAVERAASLPVQQLESPRPQDTMLAQTSLAVPSREAALAADRPELARVDADLLDTLLNTAGEVSIARARVEQQLELVSGNLSELSRTVTRLKQQLGSLEVETEAQIRHGHDDAGSNRSDFDPLELDRYSAIQQYSRALAETASDVASLQQLLETQTTDAQALLQQQSRVVSELQNGLLRTRMVSFQRHVPRLARIVRQTAAELGKPAELLVEGASGELDRQVLDRLLPPLEHLLRNAVVHGIEAASLRASRNKAAVGTVRLTLRREGAEIVLVVADDGNGMDLDAIRSRARADGLLAPGRDMAEDDLLQLILEPGFSTAGTLTQHAGRGIGMDVVATELRKLGGTVQLHSAPGSGASITLRLPFTMAVTQALMVRIGDECYALPLPVVDGVVRQTGAEIATHMTANAPAFVHAGHRYRIQHLGAFVGLESPPVPKAEPAVQVVLVRAGDYSTGLVVDELLGTREIVLKNIGPQLSSIRGISGATLLGDGRIAIILDVVTLLRTEWLARSSFALQPVQTDVRPVILVVDDSITVRRVTQRLLERNGMRVITARDGLDALTVMEELLPDVVLLDVEMPRMDGYELVERLRADGRTRALPVIMITSRVGEKHRARALELGVSDYLGKPYQESQLLESLAQLVRVQT